MAKLTKKQLECTYCWDGEYDLGTADFDTGQVCIAVVMAGEPAIEAIIYDADQEVQQIYGVEIAYCPWCGRKL